MTHNLFLLVTEVVEAKVESTEKETTSEETKSSMSEKPGSRKASLAENPEQSGSREASLADKPDSRKASVAEQVAEQSGSRKASLAEKAGGAMQAAASFFGIGSSKTEDSKETKETKETKESKVDEEVAKWGKPLGLPSPLHPGGSSRSLNNDNNRSGKTTKKTEKKFTPLYMDLAYVPHHGDANYTDIEFFKRVRARYYVFSGVEPSRAVFDALLEAKKTWDNKELGKNILKLM